MRRRRAPLRIPAAAMADLALLLLIFFLTTTYFQAEEGPRIDLPFALAGDEEPAEGTWSLHLGLDGAIHLQGDAVTLERAARSIGDARRDGGLQRLLFYADRGLPFRAVHPVLEALRGETDLPVLLISAPARAPASDGREEEGP